MEPPMENATTEAQEAFEQGSNADTFDPFDEDTAMDIDDAFQSERAQAKLEEANEDDEWESFCEVFLVFSYCNKLKSLIWL